MAETTTVRTRLAAAAIGAVAAACTGITVPVPTGPVDGSSAQSGSGDAGTEGSASASPDDAGDSIPTDAASSVVGSSSSQCPPRNGAALCPGIPELNDFEGWIGCAITTCTSTGSCDTARCVAVGGPGLVDVGVWVSGLPVPSTDAAILSECEGAGGQCRPGPSTTGCTYVSTLACSIDPAGPYCCLDPHG